MRRRRVGEMERDRVDLARAEAFLGRIDVA
jgi:hypothetical protein